MNDIYYDMDDLYCRMLGLNTRLIAYRDTHTGADKTCSRKMNKQLEMAMEHIGNALDIYEDFEERY